MAHDVFISYASKDKAVADAICARLEARGARCWIAPRDVQHGTNYGAAIIDAIQHSRVMVLVLSSNANASVHIPNEIERAVSHGVAVLPFRIEDVLPAKSLDLFLGSVHWLDALTPPLERHLDLLADSVLRLLQGGSAKRSMPPPPPPLPLPPPRRDWFKTVIAAAAVAAVAMLGWALYSRDGAPGAAPQAATGDPVLGCWRWGNGAFVVIRADGTITAAPFTGQWRAAGGRRYGFTWPEPTDTLALSADSQKLTGNNQYGVATTATRLSGGPDLPGLWQWPPGVTAEIERNGAIRLGPLTGAWVLADSARRIYRVTWPKMQDDVTLSEDSTRIQGGNQYGVAVSGVRVPSCD